MSDREKLIWAYFMLRMTYKSISHILQLEHGISISIRQIKREAKRLGLSRRNYSDPFEVVKFIDNELQNSGRLNGYRIMYTKCLESGLTVRMEDVRFVLRQMDDEGASLRASRRLRRRNYFAKGPNFIWHIDGYDKLKPFGLAIHGCICGYSRKIMWLNVYKTNNNPRVIAGYFVKAVQECDGCPRIVRGDFGTENVIVKDIQQFLRRNGTDEEAARSYIDGASTCNQRIESWWSFLRKEFIQFWLDTLHQLKEDGNYTGDYLDKSLVRFCFLALLQDELDTAADVWNAHKIRPSRNPNVPSGRPTEMYYVPCLWGSEDQLCAVAEDDVFSVLENLDFRSNIPCDEDVYDLCIDITRRHGVSLPLTVAEAVDYYLFLRREITALL